jgi:hypothetical protein
MPTFIQVNVIHSRTPYRLNVDHIVSYTQCDPTDGKGDLSNTNVTLATGGSVIVAISPEKLDDLIISSGSRVINRDGTAV